MGQWLLRSPISFPNAPGDFGENEGCLARECHGRQRLVLPRSSEVAGIAMAQQIGISALHLPQLTGRATPYTCFTKGETEAQSGGLFACESQYFGIRIQTQAA